MSLLLEMFTYPFILRAFLWWVSWWRCARRCWAYRWY